MAAAIVLSAPFAQQVFSAINERWPAQSATIILGATVIPAAAALLAALWHIRHGRWWRYGLILAGASIGVAYYRAMQPIFTEAFHFLEYGVLSLLFYRAWHSSGDWSALVLPLVASWIVGSVDEWYQWLIPFRAGDAVDVLINGLAAIGGVLFAAGLWPPLMSRLRAGSALRLGRWTAAAVAVSAVFFHTIHMGHDVVDSEIGSFRSRYAREGLLEAAGDRAIRWRQNPPVSQRRISVEDHYLSEGLWHVDRRSELWETGDIAGAWRENRILEKYFAPLLSHPTYAEAGGHRWPDAQREDAARRLGAGLPGPVVTPEYAYPLYTWAELF